MVKFTFASAFLILANLFALISAIHPVPSFRITSLETSRVIFSDGNEQEGHRVITIPAHHENVRNSLVTIDPPIALGSPVGSLSTVKGKAGLYISIKIDKTGSGYLIWSTVQYQWWFLLQTAETYYTVAVPDQDYYWYGESSTDGLDVKFEAGAMQTREVFFKVTISSVETSQLVFSGGEREGDIVITVPAKFQPSESSQLHPPLARRGATGSTSTVKGKAGLYVSILPGPESAYLVWGKARYE
ncbi:hypothetical protein F5887DRAFT_923588 [Amanita rubescens]|nr:hypothetical protein F5887DRAFT_923588 [Amanita rubescens]